MRSARRLWEELKLDWQVGLHRLPFFTQRAAVALLGILVATLALLGGLAVVLRTPQAGRPPALTGPGRDQASPATPTTLPGPGAVGPGRGAVPGAAAGPGATGGAAAGTPDAAAAARPGGPAAAPGGTGTGTGSGSGSGAGGGAGGTAPPATAGPGAPTTAAPGTTRQTLLPPVSLPGVTVTTTLPGLPGRP